MKKDSGNLEARPILEIEVAFTTASEQQIVPLQVAENTTARRAVQLSGLQEIFPQFDFQSAAVGVFGKTVPSDYVLTNFDRVEVYRPLVQSPTEARRKREKRKISSKNRFYPTR